MKKVMWMVLFAFWGLTISAQSLADLERDPSFKGITIGAPISKYSDILKYRLTRKGQSSYTITDRKYYSIFNIPMDDAIVIEKDGKINVIMLVKHYVPDLFDTTDLIAIGGNLKSRYGPPNCDLTDFSGDPPVAGFRWKSKTIILDACYVSYPENESKSGFQYILYQRDDDY